MDNNGVKYVDKCGNDISDLFNEFKTDDLNLEDCKILNENYGIELPCRNGRICSVIF